MYKYRASKCSARRYVRPSLEELEWRCVLSFLGVEIPLPILGNAAPPTLSVSIGMTPSPTTATIYFPATAMPGTTPTSSSATAMPGTATAAPSFELILWSTSPATSSSNSSSAPTAGSNAGASQQPPPAANASGTGASSISLSSVSQQATFQVSGGTFVFPSFAPAAAASALGSLAAPTGAFPLAGGTVNGLEFGLIGNLPVPAGWANFLQGTTSNSVSSATPAGAPSAGSPFAKPTLSADQTAGSAPAFGLSHPPQADQLEPLPDTIPPPPDEEWVEAAPQVIANTIPPGDDLLPEQFVPLPILPMISPYRPEVSAPRISDAPFAPLPEGFAFCEEEVVLPTDEQQSEERSSMAAAVAILSFGAGAYWTRRFRSNRESSDDLLLMVREI